MPPKGKGSAPTRLKDALVLHRWALSLFGLKDFASLASDLKDSKLEGWNEKGESRFFLELSARYYDSPDLPQTLLRQYDENILRHTKAISERREGILHWKYFQYLSLLFVEIYLDRYFSDRQKLLNDLNAFLQNLKTEEGGAFNDVTPFEDSDIRKLALWSATGSGKTFIMHVNVHQFGHYLKKFGKSSEINRVIVLTSKEGLSRQHEKELKESGFWAEIFDKRASSTHRADIVDIIDIHKLEETDGDKTVAVESFESNNLVLVDEGHRGAGGDKWKTKRERLCEEGFSFEYSATFGQAIHAATGPKRKALLSEYSKSVILDYSYKYFHEDGYGKDYRILNVSDAPDETVTSTYLIGSLMSFYEQLFVYQNEPVTAKRFMIEKPLAIFVGGTVNAVKTENKAKVSDVILVLKFFESVLRNPDTSKASIRNILTGQDGIGSGGLFRNQFAFLKDAFSLGGGAYDVDRLYEDLLEKVFNCQTPGSHLHIENLKGQTGEIGLRAGGDFFGVINVGDDAELLKLCEAEGFVTGSRDFSQSLFHTINERNSPVNVLIGSKKFSEGWSSWRVSTMGLMNIGRSEGSEIIQLFGRGVRLKGYGHWLRRSKYLKREGMIERSLGGAQISLLETLCVFGVRSDYMAQFREYLEEEGVPTSDMEEVTIRVRKNFADSEIRSLKYLEPSHGADFKKSGRVVHFTRDERVRITLDWYAKIQSIDSVGASFSGGAKDINALKPEHLEFVDWESLYFELQRHKADRSYHAASVSMQSVRKLFETSDWYQLFIPNSRMEFRYEYVQTWNEVALALAKAYLDKVYNLHRSLYYKDKMDVVALSGDNPNFIGSYEFKIHPEQKDVLRFVRSMAEKTLNGRMDLVSEENGLRLLNFDRSLYAPLVSFEKHVPPEAVSVVPGPLNDGERRFVLDLGRYCDSNPPALEGKKLYLLRNISRKGIGFFESQNFYPDFILWIVEDESQRIVFVDPKGLRNIDDGFQNPKLRLHETLKAMKLPDAKVTLDAYILSVTAFRDLRHWKGQENEDDFEDRHVIFQDGNYVERMMGRILGG